MAISETKTPTKRELIFQSLMNKKEATREDYLDNVLFLYTDSRNYPCLAAFNSRGHKPYYHLAFRNEADKNESLETLKRRIKREYEAQQQRNEQYKQEAAKIQQGSVLISSWGCEQTNVDFYLVIERKNDFVLIQEVESKREYSELNDRGTVTPELSKRIGEPIRKKISKFGDLNLSSYKYCRLWDGKPAYFSSYA